MLHRLLPVFYLLNIIPHAFSTNHTISSILPRTIVSQVLANAPTCQDGSHERHHTVLNPETAVDCLHILHVKYHEAQLTRGRIFFSLSHNYPFFYRGISEAGVGCEFAIESMRLGSLIPISLSRLSPDHRPEDPGFLDWVDSQITSSFNQLVRECILKNYAGVSAFLGTYNRLQVEFLVRVGTQRVSRARETDVQLVYKKRRANFAV